ncbi:hypothetical protein B0H13DRAFT_1858237 [Mycena leptocephala]|nr:hypothetical protein B0H13DRAFT_1858237 [Mycena leptocephala]
MFYKLSVVVTSVLITLAAATPEAPPSPCCKSVQSSSSSAVSDVATLIGLDLTGINVPIGLSCSPITVIGNNCGGTKVTATPPERVGSHVTDLEEVDALVEMSLIIVCQFESMVTRSALTAVRAWLGQALAYLSQGFEYFCNRPVMVPNIDRIL